MHSFDRTLVASLGFRDPDKGDPLHDLACAYVSREEIASTIVGPVPASRQMCERYVTKDGSRWVLTGTLSQSVSHKTSKEMPIIKGRGQYQTTVGFLDVLISRTVDVTWGKRTKIRKQRRKDASWVPVRGYKWGVVHDVEPWEFLSVDEQLSDRVVGVEVKIRPVPVGDLLRQIKLYASHTGSGFSIPEVSWWAVVLGYDIDDAYHSALEEEDIHPIRLGESFDVWCAERHVGPSQLRRI